MHLWRISKFEDLSGNGGLLVSGRWHHRGNRVIYACDHPSTALLETLVHMNRGRISKHFQLLKIECPESINVFNGSKAKSSSGLEQKQYLSDIFRQEKHQLSWYLAKMYKIAREEENRNSDFTQYLLSMFFSGLREEFDISNQIDDRELIVAIMNVPSLDLEVSQLIGDALLERCETPIIRIRSAIMPAAWNYLINPLHPDATKIRIVDRVTYPFDSRLLS